MADRSDAVPLPDHLKECGCPNAKWGRHLLTCRPARAYDAVPLRDRPEYAEGKTRFMAISWDYPLHMSATVHIEVDLDPIAFIVRHRKDYESFEPEAGFEDWEKPIAYLSQLMCEEAEDVMFSFDHERTIARVSTVADYDEERPRWTRDQYEALMEVFTAEDAKPPPDPNQEKLLDDH